ncbi:MAG TPA: DUF2203 domain-containing protein [Ktedonobacterales bacterium]|jgi:hypothetical protein
MARYFTRQEAESLLPQLEPLLRELQQRYPAMQTLRQELALLHQRMQGNGHGLQGKLAQLTKEATAAAEEVNQLVQRILRFGCQLKDPQMGLIDFPAQREGREILLCWRLGEQGINWWHETDAGFQGRQPLE